MDSRDPLFLLDVALRGAAVALFVVIAVATLRRGGNRPAVWLGALLSIGAAAYVVCSAPDHIGHRATWFAPVLALCTGNVAVFWLFSRAVFDDSFWPRPWHALLWLALVICPLVDLFGGNLSTWPPAKVVLRIAPVGLVLMALVQTVAGWRSDLVEGRRRLRLFILAAVAIHSTVTAAVDLSFGPGEVPVTLHVLNAGALTLIAVVIAAGLLQADLDSVLGAPAPEATMAPVGVAAPADEEPVDPALLAELARLMAVDRLYRQEGLTIGALATRLGLPERKVRHAINRGLGYRNFNEYLNRHRLADAKQALADPTQAEVPILTIALDSGFQSLGPFNRAFKADTGVTPTAFRRASAGQNGS